MQPGPENVLTDIAGLTVGHAADDRIKTGVTAILCEQPAIAAVHVMGGAPGTRETDLLAPENSVEAVHAIALSGGSAFGLDAAGGVQAWLRTQGRGLTVLGHLVPLVPAAIIFDLDNGGDKDWGKFAPYRELGFAAAESAGGRFTLGTAGAGTGATTAGLKGGLGSASVQLASGVTVAALAVVNAHGSVTFGDAGHFWAAPFETGAEFGGLGFPHPLPAYADRIRTKATEKAIAMAHTTITVIATDARLTKAQAKRLAISAHDGFTRAIWPAHTPVDGDLVFALATGASGISPELSDWVELGAAASAATARAIARGVYEARPAPGDPFPTWREKFGKTG